MCAATVFGVDHMPVGGHLVGAHAEHQAHRSCHRKIEAAVAAHPAGGPRHRRTRAEFPVVPTLGCIIAAPWAEHLPTAEADLERDLVDQRVTAGHEAGHQPRIVGRRGKEVAWTQITGADPLVPWHPLGREQRRRPGHQHHFADRGVIGARAGRDNDRPLPAAVSRHIGQESVRRGGRVLKSRAQILPDGVLAAHLDDRRTRQFDGAKEHRLQVGAVSQVPRGGRRGLFCRFGRAIHRHQYCLTREPQATPVRCTPAIAAIGENQFCDRTAA